MRMCSINIMLTLILLIVTTINESYCNNNNINSEQNGSNIETSRLNGLNDYTIEGKVIPYSDMSSSVNYFLTNTKIIVNYGEYLAFLKRDGSFEVTNLSAGSYLIEVRNADYFYEPIRVDINSKGKIRARKANYIQSSAVQQLPYPLKLKPKGPFKYFQMRETWRVTDFLFNPMVLMMVLPLLLIMVLPKMMNAADPETQREMQSMQMPKYDMPELSEMMTSWFNGGKGPNSRSKAIKKKQ